MSGWITRPSCCPRPPSLEVGNLDRFLSFEHAQFAASFPFALRTGTVVSSNGMVHGQRLWYPKKRAQERVKGGVGRKE